MVTSSSLFNCEAQTLPRFNLNLVKKYNKSFLIKFKRKYKKDKVQKIS